MTSAETPPRDPRELLARLDPALAQAPIAPLGQGWDFHTYVVTHPTDAPLLLRISRCDDPDERAREVAHDAAVLELVAGRVGLAVNRVVASDAHEGVFLMTLVPGAAADVKPPRDLRLFGQAMGAFLRELHSIPLFEAAAVATVEPSPQVWRDQLTAGWASVRDGLAERPGVEVRDRPDIDAFLAFPVPEPPVELVLCHNDLGEDHILLDAAGEVTGIIDWSDAVLGDPARDLALLWFDFGESVAEGAFTAYGCGPGGRGGDATLRERARWFAAIAGIGGVVHRAQHDDPGLAETVRRLRQILSVRV